jgi:hypothetical protein
MNGIAFRTATAKYESGSGFASQVAVSDIKTA